MNMVYMSTGGTLTDLLGDLGIIVTQVMTWAGDVGNAIVTTPILLFSVGIFAVGAGIGIFGRLLKRG